MSSFTTQPELSPLPDGLRFRLLKEFSYYRTHNISSIITVPKDFITDFASVPRIFWTFIPPQGKYLNASILHDYLCVIAKDRNDYKYADEVFYEAMIVCKVPKLQAKIMYLAVRAHHKIKG